MQCCYANPELYVDPDSFYEIRPDFEDVPINRFIPKPGRTLSQRKWQASFKPDGRLDIVSVLNRIQQGGVHPAIKGVVWEFLLGCYDPDSTFDQRNELRQSRRLEYERLKNKCKEMDEAVGSGVVRTMPILTDDGRPIRPPNRNDSDIENENENETETASDNESQKSEPEPEPEPAPIMDKEVLEWRLGLHQIGLDVVRTDRSLVYYQNPLNLAKMWDILAVYSWVDKDIGYCQGMSDICSPITIVIEDEADAFWCFERLMCRLRGNFKSTATSIGVRSQLSILGNIIKAVDPKLHEHIKKLEGGDYLFAFRMLMVLFRREFSFVDSLYLWELMWGMEYNPNSFAIHESRNKSSSTSTSTISSVRGGSALKKYGRFEKRNIQKGIEIDAEGEENHPPLSIFLVAGVLEARSKMILQDARGFDDFVKILNDVNGNLDAKKACKEALKVHKKYLNKVKV